MDQRRLMFEWMATNNFGWLIKFHNHVKALLNDARKEIADLDDDLSRSFWDTAYSSQFPKQLRISVFLMMFGHLEEMLLLLARDVGVAMDEKARGINRYKPTLKKVFDSDLAENQSWHFIKDASRVRNAILHSAGRISLMQDPDVLRRVLENRSDTFEVANDRIGISPQGLKNFSEHSHNLIREINARSDLTD